MSFDIPVIIRKYSQAKRERRLRWGGSGVGCGECVGVEKVGKSAFVDDV